MRLLLMAIIASITMSCIGGTSREKMNSCIRSKASKDTHHSVVGVLAYSDCVNECKNENWKVSHSCENDYYEEAGILGREYYKQ